MPVTLSIGLSRKRGLPDYGSVGASCHLEVELPADILGGAGTPLQRQAEIAFDACRLAVDAELQRYAPPPRSGAAPAPGRPRSGSERSATAKQVRALEQLASRLGLRLEEWLQERLGATHLAELSLEEASGLIEELQQLQRPALAG